MPLSPFDRALGDLLVGQRIITLPQLDDAVELAERWNVRLGDALLSRNWVDPRLYYETYAQHFDLPFVDLMREPPDRELLSASDAEVYATRLTMPWRRRGGIRAFADAGPGTVRVVVNFRSDGSRLSTETRIAAVDALFRDVPSP